MNEVKEFYNDLQEVVSFSNFDREEVLEQLAITYGYRIATLNFNEYDKYARVYKLVKKEIDYYLSDEEKNEIKELLK